MPSKKEDPVTDISEENFIDSSPPGSSPTVDPADVFIQDRNLFKSPDEDEEAPPDLMSGSTNAFLKWPRGIIF